MTKPRDFEDDGGGILAIPEDLPERDSKHETEFLEELTDAMTRAIPDIAEKAQSCIAPPRDVDERENAVG